MSRIHTEAVIELGEERQLNCTSVALGGGVLQKSYVSTSRNDLPKSIIASSPFYSRVNCRYLIRCGRSAAAPSRLFRSPSYSE